MIYPALLIVFCPGAERLVWPDFQRDFSITVLNESRLPERNRLALRRLLSSVPRALYEVLECISINAPPGCETLGLRGMNIFADGNTGIGANPWPSGFQGHLVDSWYEVVTHELGHHIDVTLYELRGFGPGWARRLTDEAGCVQANYLRSPLPACYFAENPQEFIASIAGQWFASSRDVLRLGVQRFDAGNPHPLNQAVFYMALMGTNQPWSQTGWKSLYGTIFSYTYQNGIPVVDLWQVFPWRCGGPVQITGADFSLGIETDAGCHATAITHREGI